MSIAPIMILSYQPLLGLYLFLYTLGLMPHQTDDTDSMIG